MEFQSPAHMARILIGRGHAPSTVRAMVSNEFGRCPSLSIIEAMRARLPKPRVREVGSPDAENSPALSQPFRVVGCNDEFVAALRAARE